MYSISMKKPKTRGELKRLLQQGEPCIVAEYVSEMTATILRGWLDFKDFEIIPSDDPDWVIFQPTTQNLPTE